MGKITLFFMFLFFCLSVWGYNPPIGIPEPDFGIDESHLMYIGKYYDTGGFYYRDGGNGPYTHYIDNTDPKATDANNPYGTKEKPRRSFPDESTIGPGAVIEMHGGPYSFSWYNWKSKGTKEKPIFWRGPSIEDKPSVVAGEIYMSGQYIIVENINFGSDYKHSAAILVRPLSNNDFPNHIALRYCDMAKPTGAVNYLNDVDVEDVVVYRNHIRFYNMIGPDENVERDTCGVPISSHCNKIWILENHIHHISGDGIGAGHNAHYTARNYYVGKNIIHDTCENAIDVKEVDTIVISQNTCYNFAGASAGSGGGGIAMVFHYGPNLSPKNVWVIYNDIYNANLTGIGVGGAQEHTVYIIGNRIHAIHDDIVMPYMFENFDMGGEFIYNKLLKYNYINSQGKVDDSFNSLNNNFKNEFPSGYDQFDEIEALLLKIKNNVGSAWAYKTWSSRTVYFVNNTCYDIDNGLFSQVGGDANRGRLILINNIISKVRPNGFSLLIGYSPQREASVIRNNIFYQPYGNVMIKWGYATYDLNELISNTDKGQGCLDINPYFVDADNNDFRLQDNSPAIDVGANVNVYDLFENLFGISIKYDSQGTVRPQGKGWDIGAYEYVSGSYVNEDVNQDGSVNISDVQLVVNVILGNAESGRADVNGDGMVTISDVQAVANNIVG